MRVGNVNNQTSFGVKHVKLRGSLKSLGAEVLTFIKEALPGIYNLEDNFTKVVLSQGPENKTPLVLRIKIIKHFVKDGKDWRGKPKKIIIGSEKLTIDKEAPESKEAVISLVQDAIEAANKARTECLEKAQRALRSANALEEARELARGIENVRWSQDYWARYHL